MTLLYEVPTHLNVEDRLLFGLSARQLVRIMVAGSFAYGVWDQLTVLPDPLRAALAGLVAVLGLVVAVVQPGNRPLDQWVVAATVYVVSPHRFAWRPALSTDGPAETTNDWEDIVPLPAWAGRSRTPANDYTDSAPPRRKPHRLRTPRGWAS